MDCFGPQRDPPRSLKLKSILPFIPTYEQELYREHVAVVWFEKDFSQSYYNREHMEIPSNACTLISVLLAGYIHSRGIKFHTLHSRLDAKLLQTLAETMLEGNDRHRALIHQDRYRNVNFTVPEALSGGGMIVRNLTEWEFHVYRQNMQRSLFANLCEQLNKWREVGGYLTKNPGQLFVVVISEQRSALLTLQVDGKKAIIFDSHRHLSHGSVLAQTDLEHLECLCRWYSDMQSYCFSDRPKCYELSFLYHKSSE